jgi:hypothetical protein
MGNAQAIDTDAIWRKIEADNIAKFGADWHCDSWWYKKLGPPCVFAYLDWARAPAHGAFRQNKPPLYATHAELGRVRVVMASRFGDVGITPKLTDARGYEKRVCLGELSDFGDRP